MRKLLLFLLLFITTSAAVFAQKQTTVYCKMTINDFITFNGKIKGRQVDIDYGTNTYSLIANDTAAIAKLTKVKTMTNIIDAMNYMNSIGWELITLLPRAGEYSCFYKKELEK